MVDICAPGAKRIRRHHRNVCAYLTVTWTRGFEPCLQVWARVLLCRTGLGRQQALARHHQHVHECRGAFLVGVRVGEGESIELPVHSHRCSPLGGMSGFLEAPFDCDAVVAFVVSDLLGQQALSSVNVQEISVAVKLAELCSVMFQNPSLSHLRDSFAQQSFQDDYRSTSPHGPSLAKVWANLPVPLRTEHCAEHCWPVWRLIYKPGHGERVRPWGTLGRSSGTT